MLSCLEPNWRLQFGQSSLINKPFDDIFNGTQKPRWTSCMYLDFPSGRCTLRSQTGNTGEQRHGKEHSSVQSCHVVSIGTTAKPVDQTFMDWLLSVNLVILGAKEKSGMVVNNGPNNTGYKPQPSTNSVSKYLCDSICKIGQVLANLGVPD